MKRVFFVTVFLCLIIIQAIGQTTYTIFQTSDAPATALANDGNGISVGVKFRATQNGNITGIRYYKGSGTGGTHTGQLYTSSGVLLAQAVFTGESSSGWQQVIFPVPVPVYANTTYVASMHSLSGDYCYTNPYFSSATTNGPLKALANGEDGVNGLYSYSSTPIFPSNNYQSGNYWVDVVYTPPAVNGTTGYVPKFTTSNTVGSSLIYDNGQSVGIGISSFTDTTYKLFVAAGIRSRKIRVDQSSWADYVFNKDYQLPSLQQVEEYILRHKHLPDMPSATEVGERGLDLGDSQALLLRKIEELTLYIIEQNKKIADLEKKLTEIDQRVVK